MKPLANDLWFAEGGCCGISQAQHLLMNGAAGLKIEIGDLQVLRRANEELRTEKAERIRQKLPGVIRLVEGLHVASLDDAANLWLNQILQQPLWTLKRMAERVDAERVQPLLSGAHFIFSVVMILLSDEADVFLLNIKTVKRLLKLGIKLYKIFKALKEHFFLEAATVDLSFQKAQYQTISNTWRDVCTAGKATMFAQARKATGKKPLKRPERRESYVDPEFRRRRDEIERLASTNEQKESFIAEFAQIDVYVQSLLATNPFNIVHTDAKAFGKLAEHAAHIFCLDNWKPEDGRENASSSSRQKVFEANLPRLLLIQRWYRKVLAARSKAA